MSENKALAEKPKGYPEATVLVFDGDQTVHGARDAAIRRFINGDDDFCLATDPNTDEMYAAMYANLLHGGYRNWPREHWPEELKALVGPKSYLMVINKERKALNNKNNLDRCKAYSETIGVSDGAGIVQEERKGAGPIRVSGDPSKQ